MPASCLRPLALAATLFAVLVPPARAGGPDDVKHVIIIYGENRSFDNLYGLFPGADGIANAGTTATQVDKNDKPYVTLPQPLKRGKPDTRFNTPLPNKPFDIGKFAAINLKTGDPTHRYWHEIAQINGGRMNKFVAWTNVGGLVMGHYDGRSMDMWQMAKDYRLADRFFHGAFGGSFLNHMFLVCACAPRFENSPSRPSGIVAKDEPMPDADQSKLVTHDGYAVNTLLSVYKPHDPDHKGPLLPAQTMPTIGDRLNDKKIDWAWYSGGWDDAMAGKAAPNFQFHHQPFSYFQNFGDGKPAKARYLKDLKDFETAVRDNKLPAVSFYKPIGDVNQHSGYSDVVSGDRHIRSIIAMIEAKKEIWNNALIIVTYDEHGGYWDHVPPPKGNLWGPGLRVPTLFIGPMVKKGIDNTVYETASILAFLERKYGLEPLTERDRNANPLTGIFD